MPGRLFPKSFEGQAPQEFGIGANILKTRTFDLSVARDLEQIEIGGSCIWAMAASSLTASIDVRINDQLRDPLTFQQGMFIRGVPFSRVYVSHAAQVGATITLFFAVEQDVRNIEIINPSTQFNNVNIGNISQDDSWFYHSLRQEVFIGAYSMVAGGLDSNHVELWNPADSGKNLLCDNLIISNLEAAVDDIFTLRHHNAALANAGVQGNKYLNAGVGVGLIKYQNCALAGTEISRLYILRTQRVELTLDNPILIPEGFGLVVACNNASDRDTCVSFEWVEIDA